MSNGANQAKIFLSYAKEDTDRVTQLFHWLEDAGFKPWMNSQNILPGQDTATSIRKAIHDSDFFITFLSNRSINERGQLQKEIKEALDIWQEMLIDDIYIIPIRIESCEVPEYLGNFQCMDLFEDENWSLLAKAIQVGLEKRQQGAKAEALVSAKHPLDYQYDVFLSYPTSQVHPIIEGWVERFFLPLLRHYVEDALGRYPEIYVAKLDDRPIHDKVHHNYKSALAFSKCLVPVWSPSYFLLPWSRYECSMMLNRERQLGYGTIENPSHLLLPVIGCDGNSFPAFGQNIPKLILNDFVTQAPAFESLPMYFDFRELVRKWVQVDVAETINNTSPFKPEWLTDRILPLPPSPRPSFRMPLL